FAAALLGQPRHVDTGEREALAFLVTESRGVKWPFALAVVLLLCPLVEVALQLPLPLLANWVVPPRAHCRQMRTRARLWLLPCLLPLAVPYHPLPSNRAPVVLALTILYGQGEGMVGYGEWQVLLSDALDDWSRGRMLLPHENTAMRASRSARDPRHQVELPHRPATTPPPRFL